MIFGWCVFVYFVGVALTLGVQIARDSQDEVGVLAAFGWPFTIFVLLGYWLGKLTRDWA